MQAVEIRTSTVVGDGRAAIGIVIRDVDGQVLRAIGRVLAVASPEVLAYRAVLRGVWTARHLGARRVRVLTEYASIVAQLQSGAEVPVDLIGLYLQTKAMLNAYRWSAVEVISHDQNTEAALVAAGALAGDQVMSAAEDDDVDLLPLWLFAEPSPDPVGRH
jgi:ribonuclease HI